MKKLLLSIVTAVIILTASVPASEQLMGGWTAVSDTALTSQAEEAFEKATEGFDDVIYTPAALLATQIVAGTNYCLLCREAYPTQDVPDRYVLMYIYADLQGGAKVLEISDIQIGVSALSEETDSTDAVTFGNSPD